MAFAHATVPPNISGALAEVEIASIPAKISDRSIAVTIRQITLGTYVKIMMPIDGIRAEKRTLSTRAVVSYELSLHLTRPMSSCP